MVINRFLAKVFLILTGIILTSVLIRSIILGGNEVVALSPGPQLAGQISSVLGPGTLGTSDSLPQVNQNYRIKDIRYFDNKKWVVVKILPLNHGADPAIVILKEIDGVYQAVLGPAGEFSTSYTYVLPQDVTIYLNQQGAFSGE